MRRAFALTTCLVLFAAAQLPMARAADAPATDADFKFQGEYVGEVQSKDGPRKVGVQVIALGKGKFQAVGHTGGLPGDGWDKGEKHEIEGEATGDAVVFKKDEHGATLKDGVIKISAGDKQLGELKKVERQSPTLGAKPPAGAIVLFDGTSADKFEGGKLDGDLLVQGVTSKQKFQGCTLHVEFRLPYMPEARGQGRGNSGCYLQGRYEVQVLDSFGLKGENNECGGIYSIKAPDLNMCYPPLVWQTYDIDYTPAMFDGSKKAKDAVMTVKHNGVVIHDKVALTHGTTAAPVQEGPEPGPIYLQDHGNPVRYRNIWLVEKK